MRVLDTLVQASFEFLCENHYWRVVFHQAGKVLFCFRLRADNIRNSFIVEHLAGVPSVHAKSRALIQCLCRYQRDLQFAVAVIL